MYFRNRQAIFWALFFPMLIMLIFGLINFGKFSSPDIGFVDFANNDVSNSFINSLDKQHSDLLNIKTSTLDELRKDLKTGKIDALVVIPENFGIMGEQANIEVTFNAGKTQENAIVENVLISHLYGTFKKLNKIPDEYSFENTFQLEKEMVEGNGTGYREFLVPGVAAMAIMQGGIFGVVFSLIRFKTGGVLRRLKATPIGPSHFLVGQISTRLIVTVLQTYVLLLVGMFVLGASVGNGSLINWIDITILALFGGALFNAMGLAVSGWASTEDVAAPVANIIALPMMFLSGVFFPLSILPGWLAKISDYFPLTYLADGMRRITVEGASVFSLGSDLIGLGVWTIIIFLLATRTFKWE